MPGKLGWRPDPPKLAGQRPDLDAGELLGTAPPPPSATTAALIRDILNQGGASSCVLNSIMQNVRAAHVRAGIVDPELGSRLFGYWFSRAYHHETNDDAGTYLRTAFAALVKFGFCRESFWPYTDDGAVIRKMPSMQAIREAYDQKNPTEYRRIYSTGAARVDDIKRAIAAGYPVSFGTDVGPEIDATDGRSPLDPPRGTILGGHAMLWDAYDGDVFSTVNSWGAGYGDGGRLQMSADYVAWDGTRDLWIVVTAPRYSH